MDIFTVLVVAAGLAMDAFTVAVAAGIRLGCVTGKQVFRMASHFGFFQFMMPLAGWGAGSAIEQYISSFDHWIAMGLLGFIGGKMVYESIMTETGAEFSGDPTQGWVLYGLSVATSIDAFAVGLSLGVLNAPIWAPSIIIGLVAAGFTIIGLEIGCRIGAAFNRRMEFFGGIILIGIGVKIVLDHTILA